MIKDFIPRLYQQTILATCASKNTLVVLPTGMGKTNIALMLAAHRLNLYPVSKILVLAPTKPLVEQIMNVFKRHLELDEKKTVMFTGFVKPEKRVMMWGNAQIIASTPQGLENDVLNSKIKLDDVSLLVFDEAHRAVGDYSYVWLAKKYLDAANFPRILALTASPGSDIEKINEVITNLFIEDVEIRTSEDPDVMPYIKPIDIKWVEVELPDELKDIQKYLKDSYASKLEEISQYNYLEGAQATFESKTDILKLQGILQAEIAQGNRDFGVMKCLSLTAEAMKVQHALELLETQGISTLMIYLENIYKESATTKTKAVLNLVKDINFKSAFIKTRQLSELSIEHPKLAKLVEILKKRIEAAADYKAIVFTQYRDSGQKIVDEINKINKINAKLFVGQAKRKVNGLSQKRQLEMLDGFRKAEFNILVSSSVGEEGLDVPEVDEVLFYEPIPSAIRHIQRRGRTGRQKKGFVTILITKNTRDEGYRWSAFHKEKRMYRLLKDMKGKLRFGAVSSDAGAGNMALSDFSNKENKKENKIVIYADFREKGSGAMKELLANNVDLKLERLGIGDYVLSKNVAVECKIQEDFIDSLIDGRLFKQLKELKAAYLKPMLVVEGDRDLFSIRNIHPSSIRGMLAAIAVSFNIPVIYTKNFRDTAAMILSIAKREQEEYGAIFALHGAKPSSFREQQEYIISSLPGIGPALAKPLLEKFKTIKNIITAEEKELKEVDLIGDKKAKMIKEIIEKEYDA